MWFFGKKDNEKEKEAQQQKPVEEQQSTVTSPIQNESAIIRHPNAVPTGGFNMSLGDTSDIQKATGSVIKQVGGNFLSGNFKEIFNVSKPIAMSKEQSFLESIANEQTYCSTLLEKCIEGNAIDQLCNVMSYMIAGLHVNGPIVLCRAPLDPQLGETLYLTKSNGTQFYAEQISTNPSICRFLIKGTNYTVHGKHQLELQLSKTMNTLYGKQMSEYKIVCKNGYIYECKPPDMVISGLMMGDRILNFEGKAEVSCVKTKLQMDALFNYNEDGMFSKFSSLFSKSEPAKISDKIDFIVNKKQKDPETKKDVFIKLCVGQGSWLEQITVNDKNYWKIDDKIERWNTSIQPCEEIQEEQKEQIKEQINDVNILPSDSFYRKDLRFMFEKKMDEAQIAKLELEKRDQEDVELRKKYQEEKLAQNPEKEEAKNEQEQQK